MTHKKWVNQKTESAVTQLTQKARFWVGQVSHSLKHNSRSKFLAILELTPMFVQAKLTTFAAIEKWQNENSFLQITKKVLQNAEIIERKMAKRGVVANLSSMLPRQNMELQVRARAHTRITTSDVAAALYAASQLTPSASNTTSIEREYLSLG